MRVAVLAVLFVFAGICAASADFRTGNHWMASRPQAERFVLTRTHSTTVICRGDSSGLYDVNRARGLYHHFRCAANDRNRPGGFYAFDLWVIGPSARSNMRLSDAIWHVLH